jgi:hypothetical protein
MFNNFAFQHRMILIWASIDFLKDERNLRFNFWVYFDN